MPTLLHQSYLVILCLIYLCSISMAVHAIYCSRSPQSAMAWLFALIFLPFPSIFFYLAFGSYRLQRHDKGKLPKSSYDRIRKIWLEHPAKEDIIESAMQNLCSNTSTQGNHIELLLNGKNTAKSLRDAINTAKKSILIEFFIIKDDNVGQIFRDILINKAQEGLDIHLIYDEIGCHKLPIGYLKMMRDAGIKISPFNGKRFWWSSILRINYRNHRKLVIVDGEQAWMGGLNVGREYLGLAPEFGHWRDTFIRIQGPIVAQAFLSFTKDWYRSTGEDLCEKITCQPQVSGNQQAIILPSGPYTRLNTWAMCLMVIASKAKERLWIASPYLIPSEAILRALQTAALRGVDVRLMIPWKGDHKISALCMINYLDELEKSNIKVLGYQAGFMHQKVLLMDNHISIVGSANLDYRSLYLNYELSCLINDRGMNEQVETMLRNDMKHCQVMGHQYFLKLSLSKRILARFCRLLAPLV